jgi:LemA protein
MIWIIPVILLVAVVFVIGIYNGLITGRNTVGNAFSQIDVQLTRRHDLIPNLVESAKAYMAHEKTTLEAVIQARNQAHNALDAAKAAPNDANAIGALGAAEGQLGAVMTRFMALAESYPELKANENIAQVMEELTSSENRVAFARQAYNDSVLSFNNRREVFPNNIISGMFNFQPARMLEIDGIHEKRQAIKVQF